jgi:DNA-binding transcriptional LysR family regulator
MVAHAGIDLIESFLVVAEQLNFRRSAERLNLDQSALTRRIQKLEHLLGFVLLERSTREVRLTAAGQTFYRDNIHLLERYDAAVDKARRVAEGRAGLLRVAYMAFAATELMPRAVSRFRQLHPHVDVELQYIRTQGQKLALANSQIDFGFMIGPFDHPEYDSVQLSCERLFAVVPLGHRFLEQRQLEPADLSDVPIILGDQREWAEFRWRLSDLFNAEGVALRPEIEASNTLAMTGLVAAGLGVTICPESLVDFLGNRVEARPIAHPDFVSQTALVWRKDNVTPQGPDFVELARAMAGDLGPSKGRGPSANRA